MRTRVSADTLQNPRWASGLVSKCWRQNLVDLLYRIFSQVLECVSVNGCSGSARSSECTNSGRKTRYSKGSTKAFSNRSAEKCLR
jgi:hypothetical protein